MKRFSLSFMVVAMLAGTVWAAADGPQYRLYDDLAAFVSNPDGKDFTVTLEVRDINHIARGPSELLVRIYAPDGRLVVREVIADDGVVANTSGPQLPGWDQEAWYYATCYSRGLTPGVRWSSFSDPNRLAAMPKRTFTYPVAGGGKGAYRVVLAGSPDLYVKFTFDPQLAYGVSGGPDWMHGHHDLYKRVFFYVPKGTEGITMGLLELDQPRDRRCALKTLQGEPVVLRRATKGPTGEAVETAVPMALDAANGAYVHTTANFDPPGRFADHVLVLEVSDGPGDYLLTVDLRQPKEQRNWRGQPHVTAVLCPDEATAKALKNGAIEHDGQVFWQMYQVRLWDWLKKLPTEDKEMPKGLPVKEDYVSVGSNESPAATANRNKGMHDPLPGVADVIMHSYDAHKDRRALNAAIVEMLEGMRLIGPNDRVMHGRNLAYEMGCYSFFYHRPAWRILQQSDAPEEPKAAIREFILQVGDRLAFCRGIDLINGNALASLVQGLRYCVEATGDPLQKQLFETYWQRFTTGGFGDRIGVGPSGGIQEGYGYDYHYGSYVLRGWRAVLRDLHDARFQKVYDGVLNLYSYVASQGLCASPWNSRTHHPGGYNPGMEGPYQWKGLGGPDITGSVNNANEFFYARRGLYYAVTYHGRITPAFVGESFHGQIGYSGGILCQLHIPGKGQVLASTLHQSYGGGMHVSQWRTFHIHSIVGATADGQPLVTANSEHFNARLTGDTVTSSGEVRQSSVQATRWYTFGADQILCGVKLGGSAAESILGLYSGPHALRGHVAEAYEMIPFTKVTAPGKPPVVKTAVTALDAEGKTLAPLGPKPVAAASVLIDQGGYGVRIVLDQPRPVLLGERDTVLITLVDGTAGAVPAESVSLSYRLVPYADQPPAGPIRPAQTTTAPSSLP